MCPSDPCVEKNGPFALIFSQMVALTIPRLSVVVGCLFGSHLVSSFIEMKLALSQEEESQCTFQEGTKAKAVAGVPRG
jgi:hypothetical protein